MARLKASARLKDSTGLKAWTSCKDKSGQAKTSQVGTSKVDKKEKPRLVGFKQKGKDVVFQEFLCLNLKYA